MRHEAPVLQLDRMVVVSRHEDVLAVLKDPATFSSRRNTGSIIEARAAQLDAAGVEKLRAIVRTQGMAMTENDDPEHARLRGLVNHAFTPRRVGAMRDDIQALTDSLLARADDAGTLEVVADLAFPLPLRVIVQMFGAPLEDCDDIRRWSEVIAVAFGTEYSNVDEAYKALVEFSDYIVNLVEGRRREGPKPDLMSILLGDEGGQAQSDEEIVGFFVRTLFAGHETTTNAIGNSLVALLQHPEQLELIRESPRRYRTALDELLRFRTSVHAIHRVAAEDTELRGVPIAKGQSVRLMLASANHDEEAFANPDELDLDRSDEARPLSLGFGVHTCMGAWLQRQEVEVAISSLLSRYPRIRLENDVRRRPNFLHAGYEEIQLSLR
ncbi:cytochrome P450 PksS [Nocardioides sp. J9]|nr:cytochrome P450 PksS [Nocardioides sp. J9]